MPRVDASSWLSTTTRLVLNNAANSYYQCFARVSQNLGREWIAICEDTDWFVDQPSCVFGFEADYASCNSVYDPAIQQAQEQLAEALRQCDRGYSAAEKVRSVAGLSGAFGSCTSAINRMWPSDMGNSSVDFDISLGI